MDAFCVRWLLHHTVKEVFRQTQVARMPVRAT